MIPEPSTCIAGGYPNDMQRAEVVNGPRDFALCLGQDERYPIGFSGMCVVELNAKRRNGGRQNLTIEITGSTGSACWTACWDFVVTNTYVPAGTYIVRFGELSDTVIVS